MTRTLNKVVLLKVSLTLTKLFWCLNQTLIIIVVADKEGSDKPHCPANRDIRVL